MNKSYNQKLELKPRQKEDAQALVKFAEQSDEENMVIEYESSGLCRRRRMCLESLLRQHPELKVFIVAQNNKLYIFKEK